MSVEYDAAIEIAQPLADIDTALDMIRHKLPDLRELAAIAFGAALTRELLEVPGLAATPGSIAKQAVALADALVHELRETA